MCDYDNYPLLKSSKKKKVLFNRTFSLLGGDHATCVVCFSVVWFRNDGNRNERVELFGLVVYIHTLELE